MAGQGENRRRSSALPLSSRVVGRALRLPRGQTLTRASDALALQFQIAYHPPNGASPARPGLAEMGSTGYLFPHFLCGQPPKGAGQ